MSLSFSQNQGGSGSPSFSSLAFMMGCNGGRFINTLANEVFWVFSLGISFRSQYYGVSSRMLLAMDSEVRTGYPITGSQVVLLIISFYICEKNCSIEYPCYL